MVSTITHRTEWKTGAALTYPVIIDGPYYKISATPAAAGTIYIGAAIFFTAASVTTVTIATAGSLVMGVVMNTQHNRAMLAKNQTAGTVLTKALFFGTSYAIDIAIPLPGCIVSMQVEASMGGNLEIGTGLAPDLLGCVMDQANTELCLGRSLVTYNTGTTLRWIAVYWVCGSIAVGA